MEARIVQSAGLEFKSIKAGKFRRYKNLSPGQKIRHLSSIVLNVRDSFKVLAGVAQSRRIIKQFNPEVIFIKGGYVGLPVGLAAGMMKVPYIIHESDVDPGLTNRILAKRAQIVAVGFPVEYYHDLPKAKLLFTGNPIRRSLLGAHRLEGLAKFKLNANEPVLLVVGGSSGSRSLNQVVVESLAELTKRYQVIHVTGEGDIERVRFQVKRLRLVNPNRYHLEAFLMEEMALAYAAADLVICRAGANTIAELAALGKPAVLVPHPNLHDQAKNATLLARQSAVRVIQEPKLNRQNLLREVDKILGSEEEQALLTQHIKQFAHIDADKRLAEAILSLAEAQD